MRLPSCLSIPAALIVIVIFCSVSAHGQLDGAEGYTFHPNQVIQVASLPSVVADSTADADVLTASVASAVMDPDVCCDRKSALVDQLGSVTTSSLQAVGEELRGKHYLDSGASIVISDQFWAGAAIHAEEIIATLAAQRPLMMVWKGHLYVVSGAIFDEYLYYSGANMCVIHKLLLVDTRFSGKRRHVTFDRQTDDWSNVSGLLSLAITR